VGLERGPLGLVSTIEELFERKSSGFGLESREYGRRDPSRSTLLPQKLALTSPRGGGCSVGIVRSLRPWRFFLAFLFSYGLYVFTKCTNLTGRNQ
jgi:hypothetical protein